MRFAILCCLILFTSGCFGAAPPSEGAGSPASPGAGAPPPGSAAQPPAPASAPPTAPGPCDLPPPPEDVPLHSMVARTRSTARAGYESLGARFEIIPGPFPDTSGCVPTPHSQVLTNASANRIDSEAAAPFAHLSRLTFVSGRQPDEPSPAVGELYLHGDADGYVVVRGVDLRKFLFQDVVLNDCSEPGVCDSERLPGPDNEWLGAEPAAEGYANEPFDSDRFACIRNVHGFFAEFNRITKKVREQTPQEGDERLLHLTNNCREPGNYELALISSRHGKLWKNHVSLDIGFYAQVLGDIAVAHRELGTGLRVVGTERRSDGSYRYEEVAPKDFPAGCSIANLAPYVGKAQRMLTSGLTPVALEFGPIPFTEFSAETNAKSGRAQDESIVYVEVRPRRPGPSAWRSAGFHFVQTDGGPVLRVAEEVDWRTLAARVQPGTRIWAPHTFGTFRDVQAHPFSISAFEVDGRYLGRLREERLQTNATRLYSFDYAWLDGLRRVEIREAIEPDGQGTGRVEFRLLNRQCGKPGQDCINLVVGNIALEPGEETCLVLGIGTQPLRDLYENNVLQDAQQYALTYDEEGHITELVGRYGLGLVVVRRRAKAPSEYTIDLVSYERAVPLWRGVVTVP